MKTRIISALFALALLSGMLLIWKTQGVLVICSIAVIGGIYEYSKLTLGHAEAPIHIKVGFLVLTTALFFTVITEERLAVLAAATSSILYLAMVLMSVRKRTDLEYTMHLQAVGIMGFLYCGIFPGLALRTLFLGDGLIWFLGLLFIVFSGDTFAYLVGRTLGKRKLLEPVSPKKTLEGSLGGLLGSSFAGALLQFTFLPEASLPMMTVLAIATGIFAQMGDLFESLLKRVAEVKDSGSIMPGHGGVLDRIDGVLFAAPVYYLLARFLA